MTNAVWSRLRACRLPAARLKLSAKILCCATALVVIVHAGIAIAGEEAQWPNRPVRIIVPYGPGGLSDLVVRMTAERLGQIFGQNFLLENRPGGGGIVGVQAAVRSPRDGYTLLQAGGTQFSVVPLLHQLNYDPLTDLAPISMIAENGMALAVNLDLPVHSVAELIDYAKANPGKLNYGTSGAGTSSHLVPAAFAARTGIDIVAVQYQSTPASVLGVVSGSIQMFFGNASDIIETARAGRVRLLALSNAARVAQFADVPTVAETVPGFVMTGWNGYFAPAGTPESIIGRMAHAVAAICREPEIIEKLRRLNIEPVGNSPQEVAAIIRRELPIYAAAVEAAGLLRK